MRLLALTLVVVPLAMLMPHLPGRYDASAATLSILAQLGSYASVAFVPISLAWMTSSGRGRLPEFLTWLAACLTLCVIAVSAAALNQLALGLIIASAGFVATAHLRRHADVHTRPQHLRLGIALAITPITLVGLALVTVPLAAGWSRDRAIRHSAPLIEAIEAFHQRNGRYPVSLHSLNRDVPTGIVGVERFQYEPNGLAYNLFFVRPAVALDAMEAVIFNPRGERRFTSHELDLLQYDGEVLDRRRGDRRRTPLRQPGWISIIFD